MYIFKSSFLDKISADNRKAEHNAAKLLPVSDICSYKSKLYSFISLGLNVFCFVALEKVFNLFAASKIKTFFKTPSCI